MENDEFTRRSVIMDWMEFQRETQEARYKFLRNFMTASTNHIEHIMNKFKDEMGHYNHQVQVVKCKQVIEKPNETLCVAMRVVARPTKFTAVEKEAFAEIKYSTDHTETITMMYEVRDDFGIPFCRRERKYEADEITRDKVNEDIVEMLQQRPE